jgi:hypothetical protein
VVISRHPAEYGGHDISVILYDDQGRVLDETDDVEVSKAFPNDKGLIWSLFADARRKALGVDAALDKILKDLPDDEIPF